MLDTFSLSFFCATGCLVSALPFFLHKRNDRSHAYLKRWNQGLCADLCGDIYLTLSLPSARLLCARLDCLCRVVYAAYFEFVCKKTQVFQSAPARNTGITSVFINDEGIKGAGLVLSLSYSGAMGSSSKM